jgi:hypothetical protein
VEQGGLKCLTPLCKGFPELAGLRATVCLGFCTAEQISDTKGRDHLHMRTAVGNCSPRAAVKKFPGPMNGRNRSCIFELAHSAAGVCDPMRLNIW